MRTQVTKRHRFYVQNSTGEYLQSRQLKSGAPLYRVLSASPRESA